MTQMTAFASGVLPNIYEFHLYTGYSIIPCHTQDKPFQKQFRGWASGFHFWLIYPPTRPLRPVIPNNACTLRITAAAGTKLAGAYSYGTIIIFPYKRALQPEGLNTHAAWLDQGCPHCPIFLTAASRRSLGRVSVPVWLIILSNQLWIVALVSHYPTN